MSPPAAGGPDGPREARLLALRRRFLAEAAADARAAAPGLAAPALAGEARAETLRLAHDLRGAGGSYGFPAVSAAAAALEDALRAGAPSGPALGGLGGALVAALAAAAAALPPDAGVAP